MTQLMRTALRPLYRDARDAHPGLLVQRGYEEYDNTTEAGRERKTAHIRRICDIPASDFYINAFNRWSEITSDQLRFRSLRLSLESRLFIGLSAGGMLESGCAISHSYGMPYIPGSSIKGAVTSYVCATDFGRAHPEVARDFFGSEPCKDYPEGLAGIFTFHDAWWVPGSAERPMGQEVVTSHHLDYYGSEGRSPATDLDSPIPNAQIAVRGAFLFVIEGSLGWMHLAEEMLTATLTSAGLGAKRRSGYGYFVGQGGNGVRSQWVDDTIAALMQKNRSKEDEALRGKGLAELWQAIDDPELKRQALEDIRSRWQARDWWAEPPGGSARKAKAIYEPPEVSE